MKFERFPSSIDDSVNYVADLGADGKLEARYVHRPGSRHHNIYVSSQTYCAQGCKFCHLTASGQNTGRGTTSMEIGLQVLEVLKHSPIDSKDELHILFMARGEFMATELINNWDDVVLGVLLARRCVGHTGPTIFKISTIMPITMPPLRNFLAGGAAQPIIYYSMYSTSLAWLRKWMPNAQDPSFALRELVDWQTVTGGMPVVIHFAPVPGQTDTPESVAKLVKMVRESGLRVSYNLVNFNPPPTWTNQLYTLGQKSLETIRGYILDVEPNAQVNIKERVGRDVYASCGMFVSK